MRLLVYSDATGWGGAEIALSHLVAELAPSIDVHVAAVDAMVLDRVVERRAGVGRTLLPPIAGKWDLAAMTAHRQVVTRLRPDVFHANLQMPAAAQYAITAALTVPWVRVVAVEQLPMEIPSLAGRRLKRLTSRRLAAHVAVGEASARMIEQLFTLAPGSVRTVHNGVPDLPQAVRRPSQGVPVLGAVGRLHRQKGFDVLVRAMADFPDARLVIVGDGPMRGELERLADSAGVADRVRLPGWSADPGKCLSEFDVFVLPSRFEGFPLSIVEAMLAALPVVAADVGSVSEAVRPETGLLVPADDLAALTHALRHLLRDPVRRHRMGAAGRQRALELFTADRMARRFEAVYDGLLGSGPLQSSG